MGTKGSREQDAIVRKAMSDMGDKIERERNRAFPAGMDTHAAGSIGGGDQAGRKGKISTEDKRK